jgi:hypothetical protein
MAKLVHAKHQEKGGERPPGSEQPAPAAAPGEDCERRGQKRSEQAVAGVRVQEQPKDDSDNEPLGDRPRLSAPRTCERQEQQNDEQWLGRRLDGHPAELEQPRREARQDENDDGDHGASGYSLREQPQQEHGREAEHCRKPARYLCMRAREPEDAREQVRVERALVIVEGAKEQGQDASVFVAESRRDRVRVVGERRLVSMEAGRVRRRNPELKRDDG